MAAHLRLGGLRPLREPEPLRGAHGHGHAAGRRPRGLGVARGLRGLRPLPPGPAPGGAPPPTGGPPRARGRSPRRGLDRPRHPAPALPEPRHQGEPDRLLGRHAPHGRAFPAPRSGPQRLRDRLSLVPDDLAQRLDRGGRQRVPAGPARHGRPRRRSGGLAPRPPGAPRLCRGRAGFFRPGPLRERPRPRPPQRGRVQLADPRQRGHLRGPGRPRAAPLRGPRAGVPRGLTPRDDPHKIPSSVQEQRTVLAGGAELGEMADTKKPSLTVLGGPMAGTRFVFEEGSQHISVGSDEGSSFRLQLPGVSPSHARIVIEAGGVTIYAVGGEAGLHVNDNKVDQGGTPLRNGDIVWLGTPGDVDVVMLQCILPRVAAEPPPPPPRPAPAPEPPEPPVAAAPPPEPAIIDENETVSLGPET